MSMKPNSNKSISRRLLSVLFFSLVVSITHSLFAACVPQSATLYADADDELYLWINGTLITTSPVSFVNAGGSASIPTYSIPPGDFVAGTNLIAAENINLTPSVVMAAWVIDVTCQDGEHAYFSNTDSCYTIYDDIPGTSNPVSAPATVGGNYWYQTGYPSGSVSQYFTGTPVQVTNANVVVNDPWLKPMYSPETGQLQPFTSIANTGIDNNGNEVLYYRGECPLNEVPYTPPDFTIQKVPGVTSLPSTSNYSAAVPWTITVCNNGAPVQSPVTVWDQMLGGVGGGYNGPFVTYNNPPGQLYSANSVSGGAAFTFPAGFGGNGSCVTLLANISNFNTSLSCTILNAAGVSWGGTPQPTTTAAVPVSCSTNTYTPTKTYTLSPTATLTPTVTNTKTYSPTATITSTYTPTHTITMTWTTTNTNTWTNTYTPSNTVTPTFTYTQSPTLTSTKTPTSTFSPTSTYTPVLTSTYTSTFTPTFSPTFTSTFTTTKTSTATNTKTNTLTPTNTYTITNTITYSFTPTFTYSPTWTYTPVPNATNTYTFTITNTSTVTNTATSSWTPTQTFTPTYTFTVTNTPTKTVTPTWTYTPQFTYTATPSFTATFSFTPTYSLTVTPTFTWTSILTSTSTFTPTFSSTWTFSSTSTHSPTFTFTPTFTATSSFTPTWSQTYTPTSTSSFTKTVTPTFTWTFSWTPTSTISPTLSPQPGGWDIFYVNQNVYNSSQGSVSITVGYSQTSGPLKLVIYNSAGEHIVTLIDTYLSQPYPPTTVSWNGRNKYNDPCASGVYILYLIEPFDRKLKRILLIR